MVSQMPAEHTTKNTHLRSKKHKVVARFLSLDDMVDEVLFLSPHMFRPRLVLVPIELLHVRVFFVRARFPDNMAFREFQCRVVSRFKRGFDLASCEPQ